MKIDEYMPTSGRMIKEDGTIVNIADKLGGDPTGITADINQYMPMSGRMIKEDGTVVNVANKIGGGGTGTSMTQVDHGTSDTTIQLPPNQYHTWGEVSSLTLTLGAETSGQTNGYWFSFDSGNTATTLSLPETVRTDIVVEPNMHYECMIVGNYMTFEEWEATA